MILSSYDNAESAERKLAYNGYNNKSSSKLFYSMKVISEAVYLIYLLSSTVMFLTRLGGHSYHTHTTLPPPSPLTILTHHPHQGQHNIPVLTSSQLLHLSFSYESRYANTTPRIQNTCVSNAPSLHSHASSPTFPLEYRFRKGIIVATFMCACESMLRNCELLQGH